MINNYMKMKKILLKNFKNTTVYVETKGEFNSRYCINNSKILINKHIIVILNEDMECSILLDFIDEVKINNEFRIEFCGISAKYILEV